LAWRACRGRGDRFDRFSVAALVAACMFAAIAASGWAFAPWRIDVPGLKISSDAPFKPFSLAALACAASVGISSRVRGAFVRRSALAFYLLATMVLFLCS